MKVAPRVIKKFKKIKKQTGNENEPDVNKEDQQYINEFSRLHAKNKLIDGEIKKIKVKKKLKKLK